jgi:hypothetical protein
MEGPARPGTGQAGIAEEKDAGSEKRKTFPTNHTNLHESGIHETLRAR